MIKWIKAKDRLPLDGQTVLFSPEKYKVIIVNYVQNYNDGNSFGSHYFVSNDRSYFNWHNHPNTDFQWAEINEPIR